MTFKKTSKLMLNGSSVFRSSTTKHWQISQFLPKLLNGTSNVLQWAPAVSKYLYINKLIISYRTLSYQFKISKKNYVVGPSIADSVIKDAEIFKNTKNRLRVKKRPRAFYDFRGWIIKTGLTNSEIVKIRMQVWLILCAMHFLRCSRFSRMPMQCGFKSTVSLFNLT